MLRVAFLSCSYAIIIGPQGGSEKGVRGYLQGFIICSHFGIGFVLQFFLHTRFSQSSFFFS